MKAIGYRRNLPIDADDALQDFDLPNPTPGPHDLCVKVEAVSVNPVDYKIRQSAAPQGDAPRILGWDAAGVVESVGSAVTLFQPGDEVFYAGDISRPGANAALHLVDERIVARKPASLSYAEAAALPLTSITAWEMLFNRMRVPYGVKTGGGHLLVINGAGGVGSILIQLARKLTGLTVVATASRPETIQWVKAMGAHHVIDHRQPLNEGWAALNLPPPEYVAGLTATDAHLPAIAQLIAPQGHLSLIDDPQAFDIVTLKHKSVTVSWEMMFTRPLYQTPDLIEQQRLLTEVAALVDAGVLRTTLNGEHGRIDAANVRKLHALLESGRAIGKQVLAGF